MTEKQITITFTESELAFVKTAMDEHLHSSATTYRQFNIKATETLMCMASALKKIIEAAEGEKND